MRDDQHFALVLPRFTPWMKRLSLLAAGVWLALVALNLLWPRGAALTVFHGVLTRNAVVHRLQLWRVVTYPLIEDPDKLGVLWTVLSLWLLGAPVERQLGTRRVLQLLAAGTLAGAAASLLLAQFVTRFRDMPAFGLGGFTSALLVALGYSLGEQQVSFFGMGPMKGRHLVLGLGSITVLLALVNPNPNGAVAVGGLLGGLLWMVWSERQRTRSSPEARKSRAGFRVVQGGRKPDKRDLN